MQRAAGRVEIFRLTLKFNGWLKKDNKSVTMTSVCVRDSGLAHLIVYKCTRVDPHIDNWVIRRSVQSLHFPLDLHFFTWSAFIAHHELPNGEKYTSTVTRLCVCMVRLWG